MFKKHPIIFGALLLASAGFLSRFMGFFFRIFLSHTFGEEQVGLYQLIFPIYALCFSFTSAGIETALSRLVAQKFSSNKKEEANQLLSIGLCLSLFLSFIVFLILNCYATDFSIYILGDIRCAPMLKAMSYALPFSAIHSVICGYCYGLKQAKIPAASQLVEQIVRITSVYVLYRTLTRSHQTSILLAVFGLVIGEFCSSLFCLHCFSKLSKTRKTLSFLHVRQHTKDLLSLSIPLSSSRILINLLQSIESVSIPLRLSRFGYTTTKALSTYGVLTGMALPCILFPSALTNSIATMLLPAVAEIQTSKSKKQLFKLIEQVLFYCTTLGIFCCVFFISCGNWIGSFLFHSQLAGKYLQTLAWICPFLYTNATLISILNGLGKASTSFLINAFSLIIRISGIFLLIPHIGINGYLYTLLASQIFTSVSSIFQLIRYFS